ncbi:MULTISPECIES: hypothetical protein [unclassified Hahella]|uniref:hypothetical protein n=1 Tax=unclassified Hahella TaxID=2624107 RepID=UPI001C1EF34A|nr:MULTISPECIES: hypothetical protein [unclassified Hahella]MBU6954726.1 hypothetical protein [Hahella sp. HN01]MDG9671277.1 hypothetical protein [Hahella sp. CR1]
MEMEHEDDVLIVGRKILEYLQSHPSAADSLQGVVRWWLAGEEACSWDSVQRALEGLLRQGVIGRRILSDGGVIYYSLEKS